jgi:hypothetical protein
VRSVGSRRPPAPPPGSGGRSSAAGRPPRPLEQKKSGDGAANDPMDAPQWKEKAHGDGDGDNDSTGAPRDLPSPLRGRFQKVLSDTKIQISRRAGCGRFEKVWPVSNLFLLSRF